MERREFLIASPMAAAGLVTRGARASEPVSGSSVSQPAHARDYWNDLPNRMTAQIAAARSQRKLELAKLTSATAAADRIALIRARVWECIGGRPEETPFNAVVTGKVEREQYRIKKLFSKASPSFT